MLRKAYRLGIKLAFAEAGEDLDDAALDAMSEQEKQKSEDNPSEMLAKVLQKQPGVDVMDAIKNKENIKYQIPEEEDVNFGAPSVNWSFDTLGHLGLDVQGPYSTSI